MFVFKANCLHVIVVAVERKLPTVRNPTSRSRNDSIETEPISTDLHGFPSQDRQQMRFLLDTVENIHRYTMVTVSQELTICVLDNAIRLAKAFLNTNRHLHATTLSIVSLHSK